MKLIYCDSQIVHHNPCFNLFIPHNNSFDNQGSKINKNNIFLRFNILSFWYIYIYIYIKTRQKLQLLTLYCDKEGVRVKLSVTFLTDFNLLPYQTDIIQWRNFYKDIYKIITEYSYWKLNTNYDLYKTSFLSKSF